jgi:hypothetical protein
LIFGEGFGEGFGEHLYFGSPKSSPIRNCFFVVCVNMFEVWPRAVISPAEGSNLAF